jgi:hypothetical protein
MPLNSMIVAAGMMEVLAFATGLRRVVPSQRFDALASQLRKLNVEVNSECPVCLPAHAIADRQRIDRYALRK